MCRISTTTCAFIFCALLISVQAHIKPVDDVREEITKLKEDISSLKQEMTNLVQAVTSLVESASFNN